MKTNRSVFITGAASGIGLATAKALDRERWHVFAGVLPDENTDDVSAEFSENVEVIPIDITDPVSVEIAFQSIHEKLGDAGLDALINNAGILVRGPLEVLPIESIRQQFEVNVFGHLQVTHTALPLLRQSSHPRILNISSLCGRMTTPFLGAYSMSKFALESMSATLRQELKAEKIKVIVIEPGAVDTGVFNDLQTQTEETIQSWSLEQQRLYADAYRNNTYAIVATQTMSIPPEKVAEVITKAMNAKHPKRHYVVGNDARGLLVARKFLPETWVESILQRTLNRLAKRE